MISHFASRDMIILQVLVECKASGIEDGSACNFSQILDRNIMFFYGFYIEWFFILNVNTYFHIFYPNTIMFVFGIYYIFEENF